MSDLLEGVPLATFRQRTPGEIRRVVLLDGEPARGQGPLVVAFEVPDAMKLAEAEAAANIALSHMAQNPKFMARYGLSEKKLTDAQLVSVAKIVTAVETAAVLWRAWNYALVAEGEPPPTEPLPLTPANIAQLLISDSDVRAAWTVHLDAASPLERAEGNASGASPNTSSEEAPSPEAPTTAGTAPAPETPAPTADGPATADSAPA